MIRLTPATFALCLLPFALAGCDDSSGHDDPRIQPPLVRTAAVKNADPDSRAFTGVIVARVQSDVGFRVQGKILERLVNVGQRVTRGQPLMRLDPLDLSLQAQAQQQGVAAARARARQATHDEARYRALVASGAVSASAYDQIKSAAETARAELNAAQAEANVARNATGYAVLLADTEGVVMDTLAEPGQVVVAGQTVVRIARAGQREAAVQLPETVRPAIGDRAQATGFGSEKAPVTARLRQLSDSADPLTRTFEARYVLEGALAEAPLGSTVTINLADKEPASQKMQVPIAALYDAGKGPGVWGLSGSPARVSWRPVKVLALSDEEASVSGDLQPGDEVVALGAHLLHEGETVRRAEAGSQP